MEGAALFVAAISLADHSGPLNIFTGCGKITLGCNFAYVLGALLGCKLDCYPLFFGSDQQLIKTRPPPWARISCGELYHCSTKKICFSCPSNFECSVVGCIGLFGLRARPLQLLDLSLFFEHRE